MDVADGYFARLREMESAIVSLEGSIDARTSAVAAFEGDVDELIAQAQTVEQETAAAVAELRTLDAERASLKSAHEGATARIDAPTLSDCRRRVAEAERQLHTSEKVVQDLDRTLQAASKAYKTEREDRHNFLATLMGDVQRLYADIAAQADVELADVVLDAQRSVRALHETAQEREVAVRQLHRQATHDDSLVHLLQNRLVELRAEGARTVANARKEVDEEILADATRRTAERDVLLAKLHDMREAHEAQLSQLRELKLAAATPSRRATGGLGAPAAVAATPTERVLLRQHADLVDERVALTDKLAAADAENRRLERRYDEAKSRLEDDEKSHREAAQRLEHKMASERRRAAQLEEENAKLLDACRALETALRRTEDSTGDSMGWPKDKA